MIKFDNKLPNQSIDCLIEFIVFHYYPGYEGFTSEFNCCDLTYPDWESQVEELKVGKNKQTIFKNEELVVIEEFYGFVVNFVSESNDPDYAGGLDFEFTEGLGGEVFEGFEEDIIEIAKTFMERKDNERHKECTRFLTAWSYHSWVDSYCNEFDSEWDLLGLVDWMKIGETIKRIIR